MAATQTLVRLNPGMTFIFVSGAGTDSTGSGRSMWARVKGQTENALLRLPFKAAYMFRPALIVPLHGIQSRTKLYRVHLWGNGAPAASPVSMVAQVHDYKRKAWARHDRSRQTRLSEIGARKRRHQPGLDVSYSVPRAGTKRLRTHCDHHQFRAKPGIVHGFDSVFGGESSHDEGQFSVRGHFDRTPIHVVHVCWSASTATIHFHQEFNLCHFPSL